MKKLFAGVLAAATMLSVSATAFASTDKSVTKAGEVTYDVAVTAPKVVLNLIMPAKMAAALNPYGAEIAIKKTGDIVDNKSVKGIASTAYKITNKTTDYGVYLDGTAITTITTNDAPDATTKKTWQCTGTTVTNGTKSACMSLLALSSLGDDPTAKASKAFASGEGALLLDSAVEANKTTGVLAGQTSQKKFAYVPAATTGDSAADGEIYLVFAGDLAQSTGSGANLKEVVWNEDDAINVNLVLKVTAGPKTLS